MDGDLFVTANPECSDGIAGFACKEEEEPMSVELCRENGVSGRSCNGCVL